MNLINLVDIIKYKKNRTGFIAKAILGILFSISLFTNCMGSAKVETTTLVAEAVDEETVTTDGTPSIPTPPPLSSLFNNAPGTQMKMSSFGTVDPVGTTLPADFDGDGIINSKETIGNFWVADYPTIDSAITPPVTMKIQVLTTSGSVATDITSDFTSEDFESKVDEGSEKFHQNEMALRTEKVEFAESSSGSVQASGGVPFVWEVSAGGSWSSSESGEKFVTQPFVNNIDRNATSIKSNSSEAKARQYRSDKKTETTSGNKIEANAGTIRAALYIRNHTVNMPVKLSNILCSLLLESPSGELIPVQSFRLRNNDYSIFSVEVYGNSEFGPYVVELSGLNTAEVENAIARGYTPKIYLVDYDMTHVADSNYRAALSSSFTGNNLKIIEENSKGRTALIKLFGPTIREMFRVTAFDLSTPPADNCNSATLDPLANVSPGITMKQALDRIACSGFTVTYGHYIFDFTGSDIISADPVVYTYAIESINGVANNFPCQPGFMGFDAKGAAVDACYVKIADMTKAELDNMAMWVIFANGKYFDNHRFETGVTFDGTIPIKEGINSTVWAGDNYDITYINMGDIFKRQFEFGTNPLETGESFALNTKWKKEDLGPFPYEPDVRSTYLGKVGLGDKMEIEIQLKDTWHLNPSFGTPTDKVTYQLYDSFSYNWQVESTKRFTIEEAFDFEISFSLGGTKANWYNISRTLPDAYGVPAILPDTTNNDSIITNCGHSWDHLAQIFTVCIEVPNYLPGVSTTGMVNAHLRTSQNNAYRETIWPENYANIKRFDSTLIQGYNAGDNFLEVNNGTGVLDTGTAENGTLVLIEGINGDNFYTISSTDFHDRVYEVSINTPGTPTPSFTGGVAGTVVSVGGSFNAKVKNSTLGGETTFKVIPDTPTDTLPLGTIEAGNSITIGGNVYTISSVSLYSGVYTLNLQSPLAELHSENERMFINANLTSQQFGIEINNSFASDWNLDYATSHTAGYTPYDGRKLYTGEISSCNYGLDDLLYLAPGCQGYDPGSLISNWLGAGSFDNNWSDASLGVRKDSILNNVAATNTGSVMAYHPTPEDFLISSSNAGDQMDLRISSFGDKTLITWYSMDNGVDRDIRGRVVDLTTGTTIGSGDFLISTSNTGNQMYPEVMAFSSNRALVVWSSNDTGVDSDIRGRFVNIATGVAVGTNDFLISTTNTGAQFQPKVSISNGRAIVVWNSAYNEVRARMIDINTETVIGASDILISTSIMLQSPRIASYGDRALVVWADADGAASVKGRIVDMATGTVVGAGDFQIATSIAGNWATPQVVVAADKALVTWYYWDGVFDHVNGRFIDMATGTAIGAGDFAFSNVFPGSTSLSSIALSGNRAFVVWQASFVGGVSIQGRFIDMAAGTLIDGSEFNLSDVNNKWKGAPNISISGDRALATWAVDNGTDFDLYGRIVDMNTGATIGEGTFPVSTSNAYNQSSAPVYFSGKQALAIWASNDNGNDMDIRGSFAFPKYGFNNFLVSPLIERNYSVKTRLLWN